MAKKTKSPKSARKAGKRDVLPKATNSQPMSQR
jgi:hypothetical protein